VPPIHETGPGGITIVIDMDATDSTVIINYNDDAELWIAAVWWFVSTGSWDRYVLWIDNDAVIVSDSLNILFV